MTKREHRESARTRPLGIEGIEAIRRVKTEGYGKVHEVCIDTTTAAAVTAVYDALNEQNRARLIALPVIKVVNVCWKLIK